MKMIITNTNQNTILLITVIGFACVKAYSQGNFENLNFESANVTGYAQNSSDVPISQGMPGWGVGTSDNTSAQIWYDALSAGGYMIAINDSSLSGFIPLQGNYSLYMAGGGSGTIGTAAVSQTGLVPAGTQSVTLDAKIYGNGVFEVSLGGQDISMTPLQTFANYTVYGGNVSAFAGQDTTLALTAPPVGINGAVELDNIQFSPNVIPEPQTWTLLLCGAGTLAAWRRKQKRVAH